MNKAYKDLIEASKKIEKDIMELLSKKKYKGFILKELITKLEKLNINIYKN